MLLRAGLVAEDQLAEARRRADDHGGTVPEHLVLSGVLDDEALTSFYRTHLMVPRVDPSRLSAVTRGIIGRIPADMAAEFRTIPVAIDTDNNLTVVMSDPSDTAAVDEIAFFTGSYVVRAVATQAEIAWALAHYYDQHTLLYARTHRDRSAGDSGQHEPLFERAPTIDEAEEDTVEELGEPLVTLEALPAAEGGADEWDELTPSHKPRSRPDTGETQPIQTEALLRRHREAGTPPELAARSGEVEVQTQSVHTIDDLPTVVLDEAALIAAIEGPPPDEAEAGADPILLEHPRSSPAVEIEELPVEDEGDDREPTQPERPARRRSHKPTHLGLGFGGAGTLSIPIAPRDGAELATPEPVEDSAVTQPVRVPKRFATGEVDAGWEIDDWGPPGTTIPPAYLGAVAEPAIDADTGPMPTGDDAGGAEPGPQDGAAATGEPEEIEVDESGPTGVASAPLEVDESGPTDVAAEPTEVEGELADDAAPTSARPMTESGLTTLGEASARLLATLRRIDAAHDRESVALAALEHLGDSFEQVAFLVVRRRALSPRWVRESGESRRVLAEPSLPPDVPSTLGTVVRARLPYRGPLSDEPSRELLAAAFGAAPPDILAVPVTLRDRTVAVLVGAEPCGELVEEHTAVVLRALSDALERVLLERKLAR